MLGYVRENNASPVSNEVDPDGFGINEYLSRLPALCILGVFKNLAGMQIRTMKTVSKRMFSIGNEQSLEKILATEGGSLTIAQTVRGYGFELVLRPNGIISIHLYEVWKNDEGQFVERMNVYQESDQVPLRYSFSNQPHNWSIPDCFYTALGKITRIHEAKSVMIIKMTVDDLLFSYLRKALFCHRIKRLDCIHISCADLTIDTRKNFAHLVKGVKIFDIRTSKQAMSLVNEEFFSELGESNIRELNCEYNWSSPYENRFYPRVSILPHLIKFKKLKMCSITLNADWITNLVMMFLDKAASIPQNNQLIGHWIFAVDKKLTPEMISANIRESDYEYSNHVDHPNRHAIVKKNSDLSAVFHTQINYVENGQAMEHLMSGIVNVASPIIKEVGPDGFGIKDNLSRLPALCLLEVFKNLAGMQIRTMKSVNKRMFSIANEQSLEKILAKEGGDLTIAQTRNGYGFELVLRPNGIISTHVYEIWINSEGKFEERMNFYEKDNKDPLRIMYFSNEPHPWRIPDRFFTALDKISSIHEAQSVIFKTQQPCNKLSVAIQKSFARLVQNVKTLDVTTSKQATALVNENLFYNFGESNMCEMNCEYNSSTSYENRFYPRVSILPHLIKFKNLNVCSMILNAEWITYLVMKVLDKFASVSPKPEKMCDLGEWIFAIDKMITPEMISASILHSEYKYSNRGYDNNHTIHTKNQEQLYAVFHTQTQIVYNGHALQYLFIAQFKYNPRSELTHSYFESSP